MKITKSKLASALITSALLSMSSLAIADDGAKALFFNPFSKTKTGVNAGNVVIDPDSQSGGARKSEAAGYSDVSNYYDKISNPGVSYWIELVRPGSNNVKRVSDRRVFKSGDKIRIHVTGNASGNLYVMHRGSSGNQKMLPVSAKSGSQVKTGQGYVIPSDGGWLKFDKNKGTETLKVVFAPVSKANENKAKPAANVQTVLAMYHEFSSSKGLLIESEEGSKDLMVEGATAVATLPINRTSDNVVPVSNDISSAPGSYAVNTSGKPVAVEINLKHQ